MERTGGMVDGQSLHGRTVRLYPLRMEDLETALPWMQQQELMTYYDR